jgi:hypothetical protein
MRRLALAAIDAGFFVLSGPRLALILASPIRAPCDGTPDRASRDQCDDPFSICRRAL